MFLLLPLFALFLVAAGQQTPPPPADFLTCRRAFRECDFQFLGFEGKVPTFLIGGVVDSAVTPRIVSKNPKETLGVLNSNGITPEVIFSGKALPITEFGNPRFTPSHVKPYPLPDGGSCIGHQTFTGDQLPNASGECIRVFFSSYQVLAGPKPSVVANVHVEKEDFKCVVFFTKSD